MSSTGDILRKKMRPRPASVGPCFAWWRTEAERVLRNMCKASFALDVNLAAFEGKQALGPLALDEMPEIALPFLVGTSGGQTGLFVLDGLLIDGLIEQQLLGKILPTARVDRPVTSIDAGLSEGFVQEALTAISAEATGQLTGLTAKSAEQDRAALRLALGEGHFDILSVEIDMGPGVKTGRFELWVPAVAASKAKSATRRVDPEMVAILQECEIELEARMEGCVATARQLMSLKVGSVLSIPKTQIAKVELLDPTGKIFAKGRLGQLNGQRAVRLGELAYSRPAPEIPQAASTPALPQTQQKQETAEPDINAEASTSEPDPIAAD